MPRGTFKIAGEKWKLSDDWPGARPSSNLSAWDALSFLVRQTGGQPADETDRIFTGGWIGYLGYDMRCLFEKLHNRHPRLGRLPDCTIRYYDTFAVSHRPFDTLEIHGVDRFHEGQAAVQSRIAQFESILSIRDSTDCGQPFVEKAPVDEMGEVQFLSSIERIKDYLRAGDIFQTNFTHRFSSRLFGSVDDVFLRSLSRSPAPFGAFLRYGSDGIISTSPERFLLLEPNGSVETRPIKGTRQRGKTPEEDQAWIDELQASEKDHAELAMIVDVERNDLGRVCIPGSIAVPEHAVIETYSNVHHLVSTVVGKLRNGLDIVDLITATFPGGSITGAPKIRAMEIIDELEICRRGVYTGAIGYISDHGRSDFNIAIRTMIVEAGLVHYHVGGGIVIDSEAESEYQETLTKGERMKQILMGNSCR